MIKRALSRSLGWRTRFAPTPNGWLHLGHARAAMIASLLGEWPGFGLHVRLEDLDRGRHRSVYQHAVADDLNALGLSFPPWVWQSRCGLGHYRALVRLGALGVVYPCYCSRTSMIARIKVKYGNNDNNDNNSMSKVRQGIPCDAPRTPQGTIRYDRHCLSAPLSPNLAGQMPPVWRLDATAAMNLCGSLYADTLNVDGTQRRIPLSLDSWGDVIIQTRFHGASYHLAVVVDDAALGVTLVTRGDDLANTLPIHRALQCLLDLPAPLYYHHPLVSDETGRKLAKSDGDQRLSLALKERHMSHEDLWDDAFLLCQHIIS